MYITDETLELANELVLEASQKEIKFALAESCTAGLVAATLTEISGSSAVFDRGFVTYSNQAKAEMLRVPMELIETYGAVSQEVAHAMAEGVLTRSNANIALSVTGIAGPSGGSKEKPVGLVHFGLMHDGQFKTDALEQKSEHQRHDRKIFAGMDRSSVRAASVEHALIMLMETITGKPYAFL